MFAAFHWAVIGIALFVQIGRRRTNWKYLWTIPIIYSVIAGLEALIAGSVTGAMSVLFLFLLYVRRYHCFETNSS